MLIHLLHIDMAQIDTIPLDNYAQYVPEVSYQQRQDQRPAEIATLINGV